MAKGKGRPAARPAGGAPNMGGTTGGSGSLRAMALAGIGVAIVASAVLVWKHFTGTHLPGCGPQSGCAALEGSVFGKIPGIDWPVSFVGLAWFVGLALALWRSAGGPSPALKNAARLSAVGSIFFLVVILVLRKLCPYCLAAHAGNLLFAVAVERMRPGARAAGTAIGAGRLAAIGFAAVTLLLIGPEWRVRAEKRARAEAAMKASLEEVQRKAETAATATPETTQTTTKPPTDPGATSVAPKQDPGTTGKAVADSATPATTKPPTTPTTPASRRAFTGRYLLGAPNAPYRLVTFSDFQCKDCKRVEAEIMEVLATRKDISLSMKHFPMCNQCNSHMGDLNLHANACWAARASEAAGAIQGNDGFWKIYRWLFDHSGAFTDAEFASMETELGFAPGELKRGMTGDASLKLVQADIEEAVALGIQYTPLMFLNGVELRGWEVAGATKRALSALPAGAAAGSAQNDHPVPAIDKYLNDWRVQTPRRIAVDATPHYVSGDASQPAQVVVFGDYDEENSAKLDAELRALLPSRANVGYQFRHFPGDQKCNPKLPRSFTENGCLGSRAAEAAIAVGGDAGYRRMHAWLTDHAGALTPQSVDDAAKSLGLDAARFHAALDDPAAAAAIQADIAAAGTAFVIQIPQVFVNGKWLPRWQLEGENILQRVIDEARKGK